MHKIAGIYDPYLSTLGGGERYTLSLAEILLKMDYRVDLFWSGDNKILKIAEKRFNLNLSKINLVPDIFSNHQSPKDICSKISQFINKYQTTKKYGLFFYVSDWSIPFIFSQNNLLHVQIPLVTNSGILKNITNKIKMSFIKTVVCNSNFTKKYALKYFGNKCLVIYPPVDVDKFNPNTKKENIILSVGRFDNILNSKKQEILIDSFKNLISKYHILNWKLILAGGSITSPENNNFLLKLRSLSKGYPVNIYVNPDFNTLNNIYSASKIYWHAAGYQSDETLHPEQTEHFGIAPVEAMASGAVPLLVAKGGLPEIIDDKHNGFLWNNTNELLFLTNKLINDSKLLKKISKKAQLQAQNFSKEIFLQQIYSLI